MHLALYSNYKNVWNYLQFLLRLKLNEITLRAIFKVFISILQNWIPFSCSYFQGICVPPCRMDLKQ